MGETNKIKVNDADRLKMVEDKVDKMANSLEKFLKKQEEDYMDDEEEKKKQEEEDKPDKEDEDEKKKQENDAPDPIPDGEPEPTEGEVKLPKADAGETDEDAPKETDEINMTEKNLEKTLKKILPGTIKDVLKSMNITKTSGTRPKNNNRTPENIVKQADKEPEDFAMQLLKKVKKGEISVADMNRITKERVKKHYDERIKAFKEVMKEGDD